MKKYSILFLLAWLFALPTSAQNPSVHVLEEVVLETSKLKEFSNTQHVQALKDSVLDQAPALLSNILKFNTPLYFKENGAGMVSSVSFRGTTASQTAVVWNGININSKFNGQTDFNTINIGGFSSILVRSGGGSVIYGTGAIGGSVHLMNEFNFGKGINNAFNFTYGSFNTLDARYNFEYSNKKTNVQVNLGRTSSDNDYEYVDSERKNLNGQYYNNTIGANFAHRLNRNNILKFYSRAVWDQRHFSLLRPSETRTKYRNKNFRNLLEWESIFRDFTSELKVAFLSENYNYFPDIAEDFHTTGKAETFITKYDLGHRFNNGMQLHGLLNYSTTTGAGTDIEKSKQHSGSLAVLLKQQLSHSFLYELGLKKEFSSDYESPFLFSVGTTYKFTNFYRAKLNISKNYRIPTFNDLYWQGSGNTNLRPETSHQAELGNYFDFKNWNFSITGYVIKIKDMIRWVPSGGGLWRPQNTSEVTSRGLETSLGFDKSFGKHHFTVHATYAYTISENGETGKQLTYVPFHKATAALGYSINNWDFNYQFLYNGKIYTHTNNDPKYIIEGYQVSNLGISYTPQNNNWYSIGAQIRNLFNEKYQSVENRFFPGRNFNINLTLKF